MQIFSWGDILQILNTGIENPFFNKGTGISVGSFDGLHSGHRVLLKELVTLCSHNDLIPGVLSFSRPLPSFKHSSDYSGDVSTLPQRLKLFEKLGIQFVIVVDFDDSFASMLGADFFNILRNACNMEALAEGVDFRCGYKGATDAQAIRYFAEQSDIKLSLVDPVYYKPGTAEDERISSSYIRQMIQKGFLTTVRELLERPYEIDFTSSNAVFDAQKKNQVVAKSRLLQVMPPEGVYRVKSEKGEELRLKITGDSLLLETSVPVESITF